MGGSGLSAQESFSYQLKLRAGLTAGDMVTTHDDNKVIGFGVEFRKPMFGDGHALTVELAYDYVPSRWHDVLPWEENPFNWNFHPNDFQQHPMRWNHDARKEQAAGFGIRVAYVAPMPSFGPEFVSNITKDMEWFAGLGLDRYKVTSEAGWTFQFGPTFLSSPPAGTYDGGNLTWQESKLTPTFFAGLKYRLKEELGFEISLRNFGAWHQEFKPASYASFGQDPSVYGTGTSNTSSTNGWALEFAITAKI